MLLMMWCKHWDFKRCFDKLEASKASSNISKKEYQTYHPNWKKQANTPFVILDLSLVFLFFLYRQHMDVLQRKLTTSRPIFSLLCLYHTLRLTPQETPLASDSQLTLRCLSLIRSSGLFQFSIHPDEVKGLRKWSANRCRYGIEFLMVFLFGL